MSTWTVHAVRYADHNDRTRRQNFIIADDHAAPQPMDYFVWVLRRGAETILVDTGYDAAEGLTRDRPILTDPAATLRPLGLAAEDIDTVIVTHLHYDHAGGLHLFPNAKLHLQAAEMAFATGPCMCHGLMKFAYTPDHICEAVRRVFAGRVIFHDGDGEVAEGVTVHRIGGHTRGLQCVRVRTEAGWLVLASDATHYYANLWDEMPFVLVADVTEALDGFVRLRRLASSPRLIVPGHDPLVREWFPQDIAPGIHRLDRGPSDAFAY